MDYRREIDGLRALAVSAVVLYHFWPSVFKFGYLGVDIFFVISGFLITLYIYERLSIGKFNFKTFYQRRIIRILPVTLFVLFVTSILASLILIATDHDRYLKSLIGALTLTSNIYFWRDGGYFGQSDYLKPLLHIWSLSVEEQFYLFFPIFFFIIFKFLKSFKIHLFALGFLFSTGLLLYSYMLKIDYQNLAFFFMPFRAWEFSLGSFAALIYFKLKPKHNLVSLFVSVIMIILGLTFLTKFIVPGLIVVVGTALFLSMKYCSNVFLDVFFRSRLVSYLGVISFSTYLWHWPLGVFLGYISMDENNIYSKICVLILIYILSMLSYKFIEQPFRHSIKVKTVVSFSFTGTIILLVFAASSLFINLFKNKESYLSKVASSIQSHYRCNILEHRNYGASRACIINPQGKNDYTLVLLGNSHAQMYAPALEPYLIDRNEKGLNLPLVGCLPTVQLNISSNCLRKAKTNLNAILNDKNILTVVIGLTWDYDQLIDSLGSIVLDPTKAKLLSAVQDLVNTLEKSGKKVFLIGPITYPGYDLPSILIRKIKFKGISSETTLSLLKVDSINFKSKYEFLLAELRTRLGSQFIEPSNKLCDTNNCFFGDDKGVFFSDSNHLSFYGVEKVIDLFSIIK